MDRQRPTDSDRRAEAQRRRDERNARYAAEDAAAGKYEMPPVLDDEDEAILDRVWADVARRFPTSRA
jgi:hypothetical protein